MKANLQHLGFSKMTDSLFCYWVKSPIFGFHWHYHPEFEITYVAKGEGIRLVGNNVSHFRAGDFVFLGSNLPHTWISDDDFNRKKEKMEVIVLQFPPLLFSDTLLQIPELRNIKQLFYHASQGIEFSEELKTQAIQLLEQMVNSSGFPRFRDLLSLLNLIGSDKNSTLLSSKNFTPQLNRETEDRLSKVCQHIHANFTNVINLADAAALANMNQTSFCRFFKKMTGQTFTEYINDLRIGKASNLLINQPKKTVSEIAYQAGFNSQTLFNRYFLKKKGMTPSNFRKQFN